MFGGLGEALGIGDIVAFVKLGGAEQFTNDLNKLGSKVSSVGKTWDSALNKVMIAGIANFGAAVFAAGKFDEQMTRVTATLNYSSTEMKMLKDEVLKLGSNTHQSLGQLTEGLRQVSIYGVPASEAMSVLNLASEMAEAGFTDTKTAVDAGMKVITAYGLNLSELGRIYDIQTAAVNAGAGSYETLSESMGKLLPIAKNLNIPLEEVYALVAKVAKVTGVENSTMAFQRLFSSMTENKDAWKEFANIDIFKEGKFRGATVIFQELADALQKMNPEQVRKLFENLQINQRMISSVSALTSNYGDLNNILDEIRGSAGDRKRAEEEVNDTFKGNIDLIKNQLIVAYTRMGESIVPILQSISGLLKEHPGLLTAIITGFGSLTMVLGLFVAAWKVYHNLSVAWKGLGLAGELRKIQDSMTTGRGTTLAYLGAWTLLFIEMKLIIDAYNKYVDAKQGEIDATNISTDLMVRNAKAINNTANAYEKLKKLPSNEMVVLAGKTMTASEAMSKLMVNGKLVGAEFTLLTGKTNVLNSITDEQKKSIEEANKAWQEAQDVVYLLGCKVTGLGDSMTFTEAHTKAVKDLQEILNGTFIDTLLPVNNITDATAKSNVSWTEYAQLIHAITENMGPLGQAINIMSDAWGSAYEKTKTTDMSFMSVIKNMDLLSVGTQVLKFGMDLLGIGEKDVELTTDDVKAAMGELGAQMDVLKGIAEELSSKFKSDLLDSLLKNNDALLKMYTQFLNLPEGFGAPLIALLKFKTGFTDFKDAIAASNAELENLLAAFSFSTAFTDTSDSLAYLTTKAIEMKNTFGAMAWPGLTTLLDESILKSGELLGKLDPTSIAYATMSDSIAKAKDSILVLNGAMTTQDFNLKWLADDTDIFTEAVVANTGKMLTWQQQLENTNAAGTKWNTVLEGMASVGIETSDAVRKQIDDLILLAPYIQAGTYEYQQWIDKLTPLYQKLGEVNPYIEKTNEIIEIQKADIIGLMKSWITFTDLISSKFGTFNTDAKAVLTQLENISYFQLDINTEGYEEKIGSAIYALQMYLNSLNPESQAWIDAETTLQNVIDKFVELGGSTTMIQPSIDITAVTTGTTLATEAVTGVVTTAANSPVTMTADVSALNNSIGYTYDRLLNVAGWWTVYLSADTGRAEDALVILRNELDTLCNNWYEVTVHVNYEHQGGVLQHSGGLLKHFGGTLFGEGAELLKAHSGLGLGTFNGHKEVPFIGLEGERVIQNKTVDKFPAFQWDNFNAFGDPGVFKEQAQQQQQQQINFSPIINVNKAGPETYVQITDKYIHPRIKKNDLYAVESTKFK